MRILLACSWLALYVCAGFAGLVEGGFLGTPVAPALERLPGRLAGLEILEEIAFDPALLGSEPPERCVFHVVRDERGNEGRLFIAYYARAQRWSGRPHDVEKCYAAQGWQEREARRLPEAHRPWSRLFERVDPQGARECIRVVHWIERPGPDSDRLAWRELVERLASARGFRPDAASIYLEFPADATPDDALLIGAVRALSETLESLW